MAKLTLQTTFMLNYIMACQTKQINYLHLKNKTSFGSCMTKNVGGLLTRKNVSMHCDPPFPCDAVEEFVFGGVRRAKMAREKEQVL